MGQPIRNSKEILMILNSEEYLAWLTSPSTIRCILLEVTVLDNGTPTTIYLSNHNYVTEALDTPANTAYLPIVNSGVDFTENLSVEDNGTASLSYGDIGLDNTSGEFDYLMDYVWASKPINIYVGDVTWTRDTFIKMFSGIVSDISFSDRNTINIGIRDVLQKLNTPITDAVLGSYGTAGADNVNKNAIKPLIFGEVHNITPLLIDASTLQYMVHDGIIESIIEVRDNGVPVQFTPNLANGTFILSNPAAGTITCSVQGSKVTVDASGNQVSGYSNTVTRLIQRMIMGYGTTPITAAELDLTSLNSFNSANPQAAGIYITDKANLLSTVQGLAASIGAQLVATRTGVLKLIKVGLEGTGTFDITDNYILRDGLSISSKIPVRGAVKLGYAKNWTVQDKLLTGLPPEHISLFAKEWLDIRVTDATVLSNYSLSDEPTQKDTYLISNSINHITIEATRILDLYKVPRYIVNINGTRDLASIQLGDIVTIYHRRFNMSSGKLGQVVSVSTDWNSNNVTLGVLI